MDKLSSQPPKVPKLVVALEEIHFIQLLWDIVTQVIQ